MGGSGDILGRLGRVLAHLGGLLRVFGPSWGPLGASMVVLAASCNVLGPLGLGHHSWVRRLGCLRVVCPKDPDIKTTPSKWFPKMPKIYHILVVDVYVAPAQASRESRARLPFAAFADRSHLALP